MKERKCHECETTMVGECTIRVEGGGYGIKIQKKGHGLFNRVAESPHVYVCPSCGYVAMYVDNAERFAD